MKNRPMRRLFAASLAVALACSAPARRARLARGRRDRACAAAPARSPPSSQNVQAFYDKTHVLQERLHAGVLRQGVQPEEDDRGERHLLEARQDGLGVRRSEGQPRRVRRHAAQGVRGGEQADVRADHQHQSQYPAALSFLTGQGKLARHFDFQVMPGAQMNFPGGSSSSARRRSRRPRTRRSSSTSTRRRSRCGA